MVLGPDELADLDNLTIIRPDTLYVRVLRTGDIREGSAENRRKTGARGCRWPG